MTPFFWKTLASFSFRYRQSIAYISTEHSGDHWRFYQRACALVHPSHVVSDWHYYISKYQYHICLSYLPYLSLLFIHYELWGHRTIQHRSDPRCLASLYYLQISCQTNCLHPTTVFSPSHAHSSHPKYKDCWI